MDRIGEYAEKCLAAASKYGEVIIITNSDDGWVTFSAERYVPSLVPVIAKYRIVSARTSYESFYPNQPLCWKAAAFAHEVNEMFTANDKLLNVANGQAYDSQEDMLVPTDTESSDDSVEDDQDPRNATRALYRAKKGRKGVSNNNNNPSVPMRKEVISFGDSMEERTAVKIVSGQLGATPKSVMFVTSPSPYQLIGQLSMLTGHMKHICGNKDSLDLEVKRSQAELCAKTILDKKGMTSYSSPNSSPRIRSDLPTSETYSV